MMESLVMNMLISLIITSRSISPPMWESWGANVQGRLYNHLVNNNDDWTNNHLCILSLNNIVACLNHLYLPSFVNHAPTIKQAVAIMVIPAPNFTRCQVNQPTWSVCKCHKTNSICFKCTVTTAMAKQRQRHQHVPMDSSAISSQLDNTTTHRLPMEDVEVLALYDCGLQCRSILQRSTINPPFIKV